MQSISIILNTYAPDADYKYRRYNKIMRKLKAKNNFIFTRCNIELSAHCCRTVNLKENC